MRFIDGKPGETPRITDLMYSKDMEEVKFQTNFVCEGAVENWLLALEFKMRETL